MKTRTLFFTLFTSISVLLIAQGFAFAEPITGCLEQKSGELYNVQIGTEPFPACDEEDAELTWSGTIIHQVHLEDSNLESCEAVDFPDINDPDTFGWCPTLIDPQNPSPTDRFNFIIQDDMITTNSVVIANLGNPSPGDPCTVRFINPPLRVFPFQCKFPPRNGVSFNYAIINP